MGPYLSEGVLGGLGDGCQLLDQVAALGDLGVGLSIPEGARGTSLSLLGVFIESVLGVGSLRVSDKRLFRPRGTCKNEFL